MTNAWFDTSPHMTANTEIDSDCIQATREFVANIDIVDINGVHHTYGGDSVNSPLISLEWTDTLTPNNEIIVGKFLASELRVNLSFSTSNPFPSADFGDSIIGLTMYAYVASTNDTNRVGKPTCPLGMFSIVNAEVTNDGRDYKIIAYSTVSGLSEKFDATTVGVTFPISANFLLRAICNYLGFNEPAVYPAVTSPGVNLNLFYINEAIDGTYEEYLGWIAGLAGASIKIARMPYKSGDPYDNQFMVFRRLITGGASLTVSRDIQYMDGVRKSYGGSVTYRNMVSGTEDNPISATGGSGNAIVCMTPFMTQNQLDGVCKTIFNHSPSEGGLQVIPCDIEWRGNPRLDIADTIEVEEDGGTTFRTRVMEQTLFVTGGMRETSHSYANTEESTALTSSPMSAIDARFQQVNNAISDAITDLETEIADNYLPLTGGNVDSLTVNNSPVITEDTSHLKTYTVVTQLGLTMGSATIVDVWNAMPNGSFFMGNAGEFVSTEVPHSQGQVYIGKNSASRQGVWYFPKQLSNGVWVMGADSAGTPDGTWTKLITENDFYYKPGDTVTFTNTFAGYITSTSKSVRFGVPLNRPINASGASVTGTMSCRGLSGTFVNGADLSGYTVTVGVQSDYGLRIYVDSGSAFSETNNTPVAVTCNLTITFT